MHPGREPSTLHFEHAVVKQVADRNSTSQLDLASCVAAFSKPLELDSGSESILLDDQVHAQYSGCSSATLANDRTIHSAAASPPLVKYRHATTQATVDEQPASAKELPKMTDGMLRLEAAKVLAKLPTQAESATGVVLRFDFMNNHDTRVGI